MAFTLTVDQQAQDRANRLTFANGTKSHVLHPIWLRERTTEHDAIDQGNLQRLFAPSDLDPDLYPLSLDPKGDSTVITWSDGHLQVVDHLALAQELGWVVDPTGLPIAKPWNVQPDPFPRLAWPADGDDAALAELLEAFWTYGFVIISGTPTEIGTLESVASRFGVVRETNFGMLFDVISKPNPVDLAYTPLELKAHTDNPYRRPVPGIQLIHCIRNDAEGGDSTLVDGLAAFNDYAAADPEGHRVLCETPVTFRYHFDDERLVNRAPMLETSITGEFTGIRNSDRLDFVDAVDADVLDVFYRARAGLRQLLNDPSRRATFMLDPGDVMMMDNRRALHGRLSYSLESGFRHLQGCYIEHDGPDMLWRRLCLAGTSARIPG